MFEKIKQKLAEYFGVDAATITPETTFATDLQADSLALMELLFDLESETGKTIEDEAMESIKTVGDLVKYLEA